MAFFGGYEYYDSRGRGLLKTTPAWTYFRYPTYNYWTLIATAWICQGYEGGGIREIFRGDKLQKERWLWFNVSLTVYSASLVVFLFKTEEFMVSPENVIIIRFRRVQLMVFNIYGFLYSLPAILYILYIYSMLYCMPKKQVSKSSILFSFMGFVFIHSRIYYKIEYNRVIHSSNTFYCLFFMCTWLLIGFTFNTESCRQ